jgi:hypothetical protein
MKDRFESKVFFLGLSNENMFFNLQKPTLFYNTNIFIFYSIFNFLKVLVLERVLFIINIT